jgi:hypothetical protein
MVLKTLVVAACAVLLAWTGVAIGEEGRGQHFLGLDLSTAVLSPKPLGPPTKFVPLRLEARSEGPDRAQARIERITHPKIRVAHILSEKRVPAAYLKPAHRQRNPLEAQALDNRIQAWPCKSGGICNWKR